MSASYRISHDNSIPQRQLDSCSVTRPFLSLQRLWLARLGHWHNVKNGVTLPLCTLLSLLILRVREVRVREVYTTWFIYCSLECQISYFQPHSQATHGNGTQDSNVVCVTLCPQPTHILFPAVLCNWSHSWFT